MNKIFKWMALSACVLYAGSAMAQSMATDTSRGISYYATYGYSAAAMMKEAADRSVVDDSLMVSGLSAIWGAANTNATKAQLERRLLSVPIALNSVGEDTVVTPVLVVPSGKTVTITKALLTAHVEASGSNDSVWGMLLYHNNSGDTLLVLDTAITRFPIDADSAVYDDTLKTLTLVDSVFTAGEILQWWTQALEDSSQSAEGGTLILEYLLDE